MVAHQPALEAVLDQPGVAIRTAEAKAALPAKRQGCVSPAVEKQQRLLAMLNSRRHGLCQARRNEASARRAFDAQIDGLDAGKMLAAEALRQLQATVTAAPGIDLRFHRRG